MRGGTIEFIKYNFDKLVECISRVNIPLQELPIATYDERERVFTYQMKERFHQENFREY